MAVWLAHGSGTVGIDRGVIRARDFACLVDSTEMLARAVAERDALLAGARTGADEMLASARRESDLLLAQARATFDEACERGLEQGLLDAATRWASQAIDAAGATRRTLYRQSERLSSLVSMAVERVIDEEDRSALFRRSLRTVVKLVKDVPMLTMRVNEDDREHAQRAVDSVLQQGGPTMSIEVVSDPALAPGTCRFESDDGIVDTSLTTQIEALRSAVRRAAHRIGQPMDDSGHAVVATPESESVASTGTCDGDEEPLASFEDDDRRFE